MQLRFKLFSDVKAVVDKKGNLIIEGYANKNIVDSGRERVNPYGVKLDRFNQNPILLFNHDRDYPIGNVVELQSKDDGLFAKCMVSSSDTQKVKYVRDLIEEGILRTFSIGFAEIQTKDLKDESGNDYRFIDEWEMHELSCVTLPMNEASTFSVSKELKEILSSKTYVEVKTKMLKYKGAMVAALINDTLAKKPEGFDKNAAMAKIMEECEMTAEQMAAIMRGETATVPEKVAQSISANMGIPMEEIMKANEADGKAEGKQEPPPPADEPKKPEDEPPAATPLADDNGDKACNTDPNKKAEAPESAPSMKECVSQKIPVLIKEGKTQEQAVAIAFSWCKENWNGPAKELADADFQEFLQLAEKCLQEKQAGQMPTDPATVPVDTGAGATMPENPMFQLMQTQLSLLGAINTTLTKISEGVERLVAKEYEPEEPETPPPGAAQPSAEAQALAKQLELARECCNNLDSVLKKYSL